MSNGSILNLNAHFLNEWVGHRTPISKEEGKQNQDIATSIYKLESWTLYCTTYVKCHFLRSTKSKIGLGTTISTKTLNTHFDPKQPRPQTAQSFSNSISALDTYPNTT